MLDDDPQFMSQVFTTCPVRQASAPWLAHGLKAWEYWQKGALHIIEPEPSAALVDLIGLIEKESNLLQRRKLEDARKDAPG